MSNRSHIVPSSAIIPEPIDPHEDCVEAPCDDCLTAAALAEDEVAEEVLSEVDEWIERMLAPL